MPRRDGTGPMGMGQMTGRGAGYCARFAGAGYARPTGFGCGGMGFGKRFCASVLHERARYGNPGYVYENVSPANEAEILRRQAEAMEIELQQINKKISQLTTKAE